MNRQISSSDDRERCSTESADRNNKFRARFSLLSGAASAPALASKHGNALRTSSGGKDHLAVFVSRPSSEMGVSPTIRLGHLLSPRTFKFQTQTLLRTCWVSSHFFHLTLLSTM